MGWTWCGRLNIQLPFGAWEPERFPAEKLVHLVEKGGLPVPEGHKTRRGTSHQQCLTCIENFTGAGDCCFERIQHSSPFMD